MGRSIRSSCRALTAAILAAAACAVCLAAPAHAAYLRSYNADSQTTAPDPSTADGGSWAVAGSSAATVAKGAGTEGGHNYWEVVDDNTNSSTGVASNNSVIYNVVSPADPDLAGALGSPDGWKLSVRLKVINSANPTLTPPSYNVPTFLDIRNGRRIYDLAFVNDGTANEGIYHPAGGTTFTADATSLVAAIDLDVYHTVDMVMVPNAADHTLDVVNIYIDGGATPVATFTDANSSSSGVTRVQWGSGLAAATQTVRWQNVTFQTPVPEPASVGLIGMVALAGLRRGRRLQR